MSAGLGFNIPFLNVNIPIGGTVRNLLTKQLESAQLRIQDAVGKFLSSGKALSDLVSRARVQQNSSNADVVRRAQGLTNTGTGLLNTYNSIEGSAITVAGQVASLMKDIQTDPALNFTDGANVGTRVLEIINQRKKQIASVLGGSTAVTARIAAYTSAVSKYASDVSDLENFSQGKGFSAIVGSIGSGIGSDVLKPAVTIGAIALAVYVLAPSLFGRMARGSR